MVLIKCTGEKIVIEIKGSFSLNDYLIFTISGISIFNVGMYLWLQNFNKNNIENLVTVLIISCSLGITNFLRFPNAIHTLAWLPFVLYGINLSLKNKNIISFIIIFISYFFLITAGYPYFLVYFSFFIFCYFFFNYYLEHNLISKIIINLIKQGLKLILFFSYIYFKSMAFGSKILALTTDRNVVNYEFATENKFNFIDIIGSWLYPVASNTDGRYYFGILFTFLIVTYLLTFFSMRKKKKKII